MMRKLLILAGVAALAVPSLAAAATGYYDAYGRWVATTPSGYYDDQGRWVATAPSVDAYGADAAFVGGANLNMRENALERRIKAGADTGALSREDADRAYSNLDAIRDDQTRMLDDHAGLTSDDRAELSSRLDDLGAQVTDNWRGE